MTEAPPNPKTALSGFMDSMAKELPTASLSAPKPKDSNGSPPAEQPPADVPPPPAPAPAPEPPKPTGPSDDKPPRDSAAWKAFKEARDKAIAEREAQIKELQAKIDAAAKLTPPPVTETEDYKKLAKEREELSDRLKVVDVTQHPRFQQYFGERTNEQLELAKQIVGGERANQVTKLLQLPEGDYKRSQLNEFVAELSPLEQSQIGAVVNSLTALEHQKQAEIRKARENYDQMQAETKKQQEAARTNMERTVAGVVEKAQKENPAFQLRQGDDNWNNQVQARIEAFKSTFSGKSKPETIFQQVLNGVAFDAVNTQLLATMEENKRLQEQVKALSAANPTVEPGPARTETGVEQPKKLVLEPGTNPRAVTGAWINSLPVPGR